MLRWAIVTKRPVPNYRMLVLRERRGVGPAVYCAMTLEHWQCGSGKTRRRAVDSLRFVVTAAWRHGWVKSYKPAPPEYHALWKGRHLWTGDGACQKRPELKRRGLWRKERREEAAKRQQIKRRRWGGTGTKRWDMP